MSNNENKNNSSHPAKEEAFELRPEFVAEILSIIHAANQKIALEVHAILLDANEEIGKLLKRQ